MSADIQEIGLGGALMLAMLVIKEVVSGLMKKRNGNSSGERSAEFWQLEIRGIVEKAIDERVVPEMREIRQALTTLIRWKGGD